jgi:hypothetical protein
MVSRSQKLFSFHYPVQQVPYLFIVWHHPFNAGFRIRIHLIRIQRLRLETNPDPDPIRIQGFPKIEKKLQLKKKLNFFFNCNLVCPSYRRSLQLTKEAIQHFKTWTLKKIFYFCGSFLPSWIRIHWPDWIRIQSGSGSGSGSETLL